MSKVTTTWNGALIEKQLDEQALLILYDIAVEAKLNIINEVPVDTGNLRDSTIIGDRIETGNKIAVNVGSDEGMAYYAPFVYYPGITRRYAGNPYIDRALAITLSKSSQLLQKAKQRLEKVK